MFPIFKVGTDFVKNTRFTRPCVIFKKNIPVLLDIYNIPNRKLPFYHLIYF